MNFRNRRKKETQRDKMAVLKTLINIIFLLTVVARNTTSTKLHTQRRICEYRTESYFVAVCCKDLHDRCTHGWMWATGCKTGCSRRKKNFPKSFFMAKFSSSGICSAPIVMLMMLLLLCGDVELNPGPVRYPCGVCEKSVRSGVKAICCDMCDVWYHVKCLAMSNTMYNVMKNTSTSWICCQCGIPNFDSTLFENTEIDISNSFDVLNSSSSSIDSVISSPRHTSSPIHGRQPAPSKLRNLKTLVLNAQSVNNKISELHCLLDENKPDIVVITETWLNKTIPSSDIMPSCYSVFRKDRNEVQNGNEMQRQRGGGVMVAVHQRLLCTACVELDTDCEIVWVKIELLDAKDMYVGAFYRPPTNRHTLDELQKSVERLNNTNSIVCLCGDFNLPNICWEDNSVKLGSPSVTICEALIEITNDAGLMQLNSSPTREQNILDLYFTNNPTLVRQTKVIPGLGDHDSAILVDSLIKPVVNKVLSRKVFQFRKGNLDGLNSELAKFKTDFLADSDTKSVDELWNCYHTEIMALQEKFIPSRNMKTRESMPWITNSLRKKLKRKRRLYKKRLKSVDAWLKYSMLKHDIQKQTRQARWDHINSIVSQDGDKARKGFWKYVKQFKADNTGIAVLKRNGQTATSPKDKAEMLNNQFSSVFTHEDSDFVAPASHQYPPIGNINVTVEGVEKLLLNLNASKAAGPDQLSGRLLKSTAKESAQILQKIFQRSIDTGRIPDAWKEATVSPIFKKSSRSDPANYRPVSLTCIACKLLEHIINKHMMNHLDVHKILVDAQHGFRKRRSCETQLLLTCHDIASVVDKCGQVDMLVLDFAKAFDTVDHKRLLSKIGAYGITGNLHQWIESFLEGRKQKVVVDGVCSSPAAVLSGVPQGSVLGPLLFLIFINDLAENTSSTVRLFADDCVMYRPVKSVTDCETLQDDLNELHEWEKRWKLKFNANKCNIMRATHARQNKITYEYRLNNLPLTSTSNTTYLGVELSSDMKWNSHVKQVTAKGNQMLGVLRRNLKHCPTDLKSLAYTTILRPKLEYACAIWDPYTDDNIEKLERVQRRAARFVCNKYDRMASVTTMQTTLKWPSLQQRRAEARLTLFHRIVHNSVDVDSTTLMAKSNRPSRKPNQVQYRRHETEKDCYKYSFIPRTIVQWNNINAVDDPVQFKSSLRSINLHLRQRYSNFLAGDPFFSLDKAWRPNFFPG